MRFSASLPPPLLDLLERGVRRRVPTADIWRSVGDEANRRGLRRPSYERVRVLVREVEARIASEVTIAEVAAAATSYDAIGELLDLATRTGRRYPAA